MERINLELGQFDVKLILKTLEEAYNKSLKQIWVEPHWVKGSTCSDFEPGHWEGEETKESKRLKSTINYIKRQINLDN